LPFHYVNYGKQTGFRYRLIFKSKTQVANDKSVKASCNEDLNIILFLFATDLLKLKFSHLSDTDRWPPVQLSHVVLSNSTVLCWLLLATDCFNRYCV